MRIATWNIKGAGARKEYLLRWLEARKPDVVALQKIGEKAKFPTKELESAGYCAHPLYANSGLGVAVLSKNKHIPVPNDAALGPRMLTVEVEGLEVSSIYAPAKLKDCKLAWFESLTNYLGGPCRSEQRVLCGDFNVVAEDRVTADWPPPRNPSTYSEPVHRVFSGLLKTGFVDLYRCRPSNCDYRFIFNGQKGRFKVSRLEFMFGTPSLLDRVREVWVDIAHRIPIKDVFLWERAPIVADLDD